jgi:N-acetylglucosaminyl-diphospho-decaprenol L-rhamnosyltransferase
VASCPGVAIYGDLMERARSDEVVVVVVTYNSAGLVPDLVASLPSGMGGVPWRLVVVDNASVDHTIAEVRRTAPDAVVIPMGRNAGYAAGINAGAAHAGPGRALLVLNPDVRLTPGCVPQLLAALERPGVGVAVPRLLDGEGVLVPSMRREPTVLRAVADAVLGASRAGTVLTLGEVVTDVEEYERGQPTDWAEGSTQLISPDCWRRCGPWDESFFLYSEETDFHLRVRDRGLETRYVPAAVAVHLGGESTTSPRLWSMLVANRVKLFAARNGPVSSAAYWLALMVREASRAALGRETSRRAVRTLLSPAALRGRRGPEWGV